MRHSELDELYGVVRAAADITPWEVDAFPQSLCLLSEDVGRSMAEFLRAAKHKPFTDAIRKINFIWTMSEAGEILLSVEEVAFIGNDKVPPGYPIRRGLRKELSKERKLGHPCVSVKGFARIAGEIYVDYSTGVAGELTWTLNAQSGRFHGSTNPKPTEVQIEAVADIFASALGLSISLDLQDDMSGNST